MSFHEMNSETMIQSLKDAGCDSTTTQEFLRLWETGFKKEAIRLLSCHRCHLMCMIHEAQKPVDILDYIICQLKKKL